MWDTKKQSGTITDQRGAHLAGNIKITSQNHSGAYGAFGKTICYTSHSLL